MHVKSIAIALGGLVLTGNAFADTITLTIPNQPPITIKSFATNASNSPAPNSHPVCGQVVVTKNITDIDHVFLSYLFTGTRIPKVTILFTETFRGVVGVPNGPQVVYTLDLDNAVIESISQSDSASAGTTSNLSEQVVFVAQSFKYTFSFPTSKGMSMFGWNCLTSNPT